MSKGKPYDPVVSNTGTTKWATPPVMKTTGIAFDPICQQNTGTQTAIPDLAG